MSELALLLEEYLATRRALGNRLELRVGTQSRVTPLSHTVRLSQQPPREAPVAHPPIAGRAARAIASTLASTVHPLTCLPTPPRCTLSFYIQPLGPQPDSPRLDALRSGSSPYWKTLARNARPW